MCVWVFAAKRKVLRKMLLSLIEVCNFGSPENFSALLSPADTKNLFAP